MTDKKIAFIIDQFSHRAGHIKQVLELANYFSNEGNDVTVFTSEFDKNNCFPEINRNFKIRSIEYKAENNFLLPFKNRLIKKKKMERLILDEELTFDIFLIHGDPYYILSKFIKKNFKNASLVWHVNDVPYIFNIATQEKLSIFLKIAISFFKKIDMNYISNIKNITTLNYVNYDLIKNKFNIKSVVVYTGVDKYFIQDKNRSINKKNKINLLSVGTLAVNRRFEDIITAVHLLNNNYDKTKFYLRIVGYKKLNVAYFQYLNNMINDLKLSSQIKFIGTVTNIKLKNEYKNADIFIQSTENIGWTIPAMEAMLGKTPTIITDTCGLNERLVDGVEAFIVRSRSPELIKQKIEILVNSSVKYNEISRQGFNIISKNFLWEGYCKRYKKYLDKIAIND